MNTNPPSRTKSNAGARSGAGVLFILTALNILRASYRFGVRPIGYHWHLHLSGWSWAGLVASVVLAALAT